MRRDDKSGPGSESHGHSRGRIEEEHRALRGRLEALTDATDRKGVLSGLKELPKLLGEHFAAEEVDGGLYDELAARRPRIQPQLDELRREHRTILAELEIINRELQSDPTPGGMLREATRRKIDRCAETLRRHERDESTIIAEVYYTDEGGLG